MMSVNIEALTTEQIVDEFVSVARERGTAVLDSETRRANQMFSRMQALDRALRSRGRSARLMLLPLLEDDDRSVRYYAAKYLLGLVPHRARATIEEIAKPKFDGLCSDAGMCLYALDKGIFKPD
jgi:hypothetical protein